MIEYTDNNTERVLFITRSETNYSVYVRFSDLHIAARWLNPMLPDWSKMPACRNGGVNLKLWNFLEKETSGIHSSHVCKSCLVVLATRGVRLVFQDSANAD